MTSLSQAIWKSAGCPLAPGREPTADKGTCAVCGEQCDGGYVSRMVALPSSFTNYDMLRGPSSSGVCVACAWAMAGSPPDGLRMWSVVTARGAGHWEREYPGPELGKDAVAIHGSDHSQVLRMLLDPPDAEWGVALADSCKLHVVPWGRMNANRIRWTVRLEALDVVAKTEVFREVVGAAARLLLAGFPRTHIEACNTDPALLNKCGVEVWRENIATMRKHGRGGAGRCALFLLGQSARKQTKEVWNEWR